MLKWATTRAHEVDPLILPEVICQELICLHRHHRPRAPDQKVQLFLIVEVKIFTECRFVVKKFDEKDDNIMTVKTERKLNTFTTNSRIFFSRNFSQLIKSAPRAWKSSKINKIKQRFQSIFEEIKPGDQSVF